MCLGVSKNHVVLKSRIPVASPSRPSHVHATGSARLLAYITMDMFVAVRRLPLDRVGREGQSAVHRLVVSTQLFGTKNKPVADIPKHIAKMSLRSI